MYHRYLLLAVVVRVISDVRLYNIEDGVMATYEVLDDD